MLTGKALSCVHTSEYSVAELWSCSLQNIQGEIKMLFNSPHCCQVCTYPADLQQSLNAFSVDSWSNSMAETDKPKKKVLMTSALSCSKFTVSSWTGRHRLKHFMMLSLFKDLLSNCQVSRCCNILTGGWSTTTQLWREMLLWAHLCTTPMKLLHVAHYIDKRKIQHNIGN